MESKNKLKRKYTSIPLYVKLKALQQLSNKKFSVYEIAEKLGVDHTTIRSWQKNEKQLKEWSKRFSDGSKKSKRMRQVKYQYIDNAVWLWFQEKRAAGIISTGPNIQDKAKIYYKQLGASENFCASNGWLWSFKERYGLKCKKKSGEQLSANQEAVPEFKQELIELVKSENLNHHQIFSCYKTGLNYKTLPKSGICETSEHLSDDQSRPERITVLVCSNISGTCKLPLVVTGKWTKPCHLRDIEIPVLYKSQKSAWMTSDLFVSWYETECVPYIKAFLQASNLPPKALLLIDNYFSHSKAANKDGILVKFFPSNTTSLIQPIDQGCLQRLKLLYKERLMKHIITCIDSEMLLSDAIKQINLRNTIFWLADAWKKIDESTIQKSWNQVWPGENCPDVSNTSSQSSLQAEMEPLLLQFLDLLQNTFLFKKISMPQLKAWLYQPYLMTTDECLTDSEILQVTREENCLKRDDNDVDIDESGEEYSNEWKEFKYTLRIDQKDLCNRIDMNSNFQEKSIPHSTLTKREADLCLKHLLDFCKDNNYPQNIIAALNDVKEKIDKYSRDTS